MMATEDLTSRGIHPLDIMSPTMELVRSIPEERLLCTTKFLSGMWKDGQYVLLYHCKDGRTFWKGKCDHLGLKDENIEFECRGLFGKEIRQAFANKSDLNPAVCVLTSDGELLTCGDSPYALGRPTIANDSETARFEHVLNGVEYIAVGGYQCLAIISEKVYGFGCNMYHQLAESGSIFEEPIEFYAGEGGAAPYQVACGRHHSALLTKDGTVLTCGDGRYGATGHGHTDRTDQLTPVTTLKRVVQIGCTELATYALTDGKLYACGWNGVDGSGGLGLGLGHKHEVTVPTAIDFGDRQVDSFRCCGHMVVVRCTSDETFYFGQLCQDDVIKEPRQVTECKHARDVFQKAKYRATGGLVCMDISSRAFLGLLRQAGLQDTK